MNARLFLVCLFAITVNISCNKDDDNNNTGSLSQTGQISISLAGTVVDENAIGIQGATVTMGSVTQTTDANGAFVFENVKVPQERYYVSASNNGYFHSGVGGIPKAGNMHYVRVTLLSKGAPFVIDAATGGMVTGNNASKVTFPSNAFENNSGVAYSGSVNVYMRFISPDDVGFAFQVPGGDLAALASGNELVPMISYGMIGVILEDNAGNLLQLTPGKLAEIRIPLAGSQLAMAPPSIPLLSFDLVSGVWNQEGIGTLTGNEYVGTVSHFSWWNLDVITGPEVPVITGKVVDCNGSPLAGIVVTVNGQFTLITNNQGIYTSWVPPGITITIQVLASSNGGIVTNSNIYSLIPVSGNYFIPDIHLVCPATISGQIMCNGNLVGSMVVATWVGGSHTILQIYGGNFIIPVPPNLSVTLNFFSGLNNTAVPVTSGSMGSTLNIGAIEFCGSSCTGGPSTVTDVDGNTYNVIQIGNQCWIRENLKTSKYRNGDPIPTGLPDPQWQTTTSGAFAVYDNDTLYDEIYGKLYNWYTVADSRGLCPVGWHVPTRTDWSTLIKLLDPATDTTIIGSQSLIAGGHMKSTGNFQAGTGLWNAPNSNATNLSGFTGHPGGRCDGTTSYNFKSLWGYWWSADDTLTYSAWHCNIVYSGGYVDQYYIDKNYGISVRCVRD